MSFGKTERKSWTGFLFKRSPRVLRGGLAWTLALLAPLTTLTLALISPWLVAPYLLILAWLVFAPGVKTQGDFLSAGAIPSPHLQTETEFPTIAATLERAEEPREESIEAVSTTPATSKSRRVGKGKARTRAVKAVAEPIEVAWVKVGPNQFVRVETSGDGSDLETRQNMYSPVEPTFEYVARAAEFFEEPHARVESPIESFVADSAARFSKVVESANPPEEPAQDEESREVFEPINPLESEEVEVFATNEPLAPEAMNDLRIDEETFSTPYDSEVVNEADTLSLTDSAIPDEYVSSHDPTVESLEAQGFATRDEEERRAFQDDRHAIDARTVEDRVDAEGTFASADRREKNEDVATEFEAFAEESKTSEVEIAGNAPDVSAIESFEESAIDSSTLLPSSSNRPSRLLTRSSRRCRERFSNGSRARRRVEANARFIDRLAVSGSMRVRALFDRTRFGRTCPRELLQGA